MGQSRNYLFIGVIFLASSSVFAGELDSYFRHKLEQSEMPLVDTSFDQIITGVFNQKIDPNNPADSRTFAQRYFINKTYSQNSQSPVFYYICGEGECSASELSGFTRELALRFHGTMIALEHRYYGESQPFQTLTTENLKYLSIANALADLAHFEIYAQKNLGLEGKWTVIGGSYSGALAAFYRLKYPELVVGALSSSGPVRALANFENYDFTVDRVAGPECADAIRRSVAQIEQSLTQPQTKTYIKKIFATEEVNDDVDFLYVVADMAAMAIQYGNRDYFCSQITSSRDVNQQIEKYAQAGKNLFAQFGITPFEDSFQGAESINPSDYKSTGMRAWLYQSCSEFGYWQTAYHDPGHSTRSARIDDNYHNQACDRLFGIKTPVNTFKTNEIFYQHLLDPVETSHILFTNGSTDPWAQLSITQELGNNTNPLTEAMTIAGGSHCSDLGSSMQSTDAVGTTHAEFSKLLTDWLK